MLPDGTNGSSDRNFIFFVWFNINWDAGDYIGFQRDECRFILQKYNDKKFAENFMISVKVSNAEEFRKQVIEKQLPQKFGIHIGQVTEQPYGKEVNIIDIAGVCWHFVEQ